MRKQDVLARDPAQSALALFAAAMSGALVALAAYGFVLSHSALVPVHVITHTVAPSDQLAAVGTRMDSREGGALPAAVAIVHGDRQVAVIDVTSGSAEPSHLLVRSGMPLELSVTQGAGRARAIGLDAFGLLADVRYSGTSVSLPALEPGIYPFSYEDGSFAGVIIAE